MNNSSSDNILTPDQIAAFNRDGFLIVENAVSADQLAALRDDFDNWLEKSRDHHSGYGEYVNDRSRFDLADDHTGDAPKLRRVNAPSEISSAYEAVMRNSRMTRAVADLVGPDVKFHHDKINSKLPGAKTNVKYHQDFPFTPHSNDDIITALLMVDEVTPKNGPLEVVPGSHTGPLHKIWHDGVFTGAVDDQVVEAAAGTIVSCTGPAGSVCLMHTRLLHGSAANQADHPRTLYICVYTADDAVPLTPNPVPNKFQGDIVAGKETGRIRCTENEVLRPELPKQASFFFQQQRAGAKG